MSKLFLGNWRSVLTLLAFVLFPLSAKAQTQPFLNLGLTSFLDGAPPSGPGLYVQQYLIYYNATHFRDNQGNKVTNFPEAQLFTGLYQFTYVAPHHLPGKMGWGLNMFIPVVFANENGSEGLGDLFFGPFLQWDPVMGKKGPIFMHRLELTGGFPIGHYDKNELLNPSSNIFYFNPYWSGTFFPRPEWSISTRLQYVWNGTNNDPNAILFPNADSGQAGQAFLMNLASSYEMIPKRLRLGVNTYFLRQFTDSKINGVSVPGTQEQTLGIGPGALIHINRDSHLFLNVYFETLVRNRPEGTLWNVRFVRNFPVGRKD